MKTIIIKQNQKYRLIFETSFICPRGMFVIETMQGNMIFNTDDECEAIEKFKEYI